MGLDSVRTELDKKLEEIENGIDAEGFDFEIVEEEFFPYAVFCLTDKQEKSLSRIDFEVGGDMIKEDDDGIDTSIAAGAKLDEELSL